MQPRNQPGAGGPFTFYCISVNTPRHPAPEPVRSGGTANTFPAFCSRWQPPAPLGCGWQLLRSICAHCVRSGPPAASFAPPASRPVQCRRTRFSHFVRALANILLHLHLARSLLRNSSAAGPSHLNAMGGDMLHQQTASLWLRRGPAKGTRLAVGIQQRERNIYSVLPDGSPHHQAGAKHHLRDPIGGVSSGYSPKTP